MSQARSSRFSWWLSGALGRLAPTQMAQRLKNPVFFIGCGRSGTTILSSLLADHPQLAVYPTEANNLWHPRSYPWHTAALKTPPFWFEAQTFTRLSLDARKPEDDRRMKAMFGAFQFVERGDVFLNKSVMVTFMIPHILAVFPEARFIHIVRDGRAVAHSYAKKEGKKIAAQGEYGRKGYDLPKAQLLEKFAEHWQDHVREIERQKAATVLSEPGRLLELTYEALCDDPSGTMSRTAEFLEISTTQFELEKVNSVKNMNYKFTAELETATIQALNSHIGETLSRYGYSLT